MENKYDPFDIKGQDKAREDLDLRARLIREAEEADIRWLMSSKRGRRIVWRLLEQAGVFRSSFSPTAMQMAFNEGYRNYGNRTLALIHENCSDLYPLMLKEALNDRANNSATRSTQ
jgi:hypothetical protein